MGLRSILLDISRKGILLYGLQFIIIALGG
jgi:hypothetical protein